MIRFTISIFVLLTLFPGFSQSSQKIIGLVKEVESNKPVLATITIIWNDSIHHAMTLYADTQGHFSATLPVNHEYHFITEADGYLTYQLTYYISETVSEVLTFELRKPKPKPKPLWEDILFQTNSTDIDNRKQLKPIIRFLKDNPTIQVEVVGWALQSENNPDTIAYKRVENVCKRLKRAVGNKRIINRRYLVSEMTYLDYNNRLYRKVEFCIKEP